MRSTVGIVLGALGVLCAVLGLLVINGVSLEFPGIIPRRPRLLPLPAGRRE